ncbi:aminotransferase class III-fold pyridoxal phosphate-dependent enzyme [Verrucomicrobium sp. BvORR034]|uniref:aminotransferase class III-fold pyridoxal phosphate-dependent enzyme n=1 Tax=Verrucomicrobium sp. BvORR034 TaxID=1396418 RepID=UPI002240EC12|nr:aminotransferase class III-fold pyridoxal phosphate-dependent enzyme [Verrucomicrobium sp. BvORR034]
MKNHRLLDNARRAGKLLTAELEKLAGREALISAVRGRGLMIAFDLPTRELRDEFHRGLFEVGVLALRCGDRSIRFRPALDLPMEIVPHIIELLERQCRRMNASLIV